MEKSKRQFETKIAKLQDKLRSKQSENRHLRQRVKELTRSRDHQRLKVKVLRSSKLRCSTPAELLESAKIRFHKYDTRLVSLCVCLSAFAGCSLRGVHRVLVYLQLEYGILRGDVPSKSSIDNWVHKLGLYYYRQAGSEMWAEYCLILDESMVVGQQRMLVVLAANAKHDGDLALDMSVVKVLGFAVKPSWKGEDIGAFLQQVQEKVGKKALYVVCDGAASLLKGVTQAGLTRLCDVGHEVGKCLEQTYKTDDRFMEWIKAVTKVRFQVFMTPHAYLLPPKQRTVARFTNLSFVVDWAQNMLQTMKQLNSAEQSAFGFLSAYHRLINELSAAFQMSESVLKILKKEGMSIINIDRSIAICSRYSHRVLNSLIDKIVKYLNVEKAKLPDDHTTWQASSDVIESVFGKYKHKAAPNALHGVTCRVLSLCLYTHQQDDQQTLHINIKEGLQQVSMANLATWKEHNLIENQLLRRTKLFENCMKN